jgi:hypothetical protein
MRLAVLVAKLSASFCYPCGTPRVTVASMTRVMALLLCGCMGQSAVTMPVRPMTAYVENEKVSGPKVTPTEPLMAWLRAGGDAVIRFPVSMAPSTPNEGLLGEKNRKKKPANRGDGWEPKLVCDEALECGRSVSQC